MKTAVQLSNLTKSYGALTVLHDINLSVAEGTFCALLGPSGCGKTTLLNIIGGLDRPNKGDIRIGDDEVYSSGRGINLGAERRNIGYVFQSYALWPHMTVLDNVGYSLRLRRVPRAERDKQAKEMLDRLELSALAERYPFQLSGGQQQRVAIARSLVYHPRLLLLDEPLSNLDAQLRERARSWLRIVHDSFKLTTILVTHDQVEALSLSDQVVLLNKGSIAQSGSPSEIYERPRSAYAAEFVGNANIIQGKATKIDGDNKQAWIETTTGIRIAAHSHAPIIPGAEACVAIRPQRVRLLAEPGGRDNEGAVLQFEAKSVLYQGSNFEIIGRTPAGDLRILSDFAPQAEHRHVLLPSKDCLCVLP